MRFYPTRYHSKRYRREMEEIDKWDYTRANILRIVCLGGPIKVIGWYADYIKRVNQRRPKRDSVYKNSLQKFSRFR